MNATLIDGEHRHDVERGSSATEFVLRADSFEAATGWALKPQGWCRGDVCVPATSGTYAAGANSAGEVNLAHFAATMRRPVVIDAVRGVAALGTSADDRAAALMSLQAADLSLPDLDGNPVSVHDFDRRKRLLLAWSSW